MKVIKPKNCESIGDEKPIEKGICINCSLKMLRLKSGEYFCTKCGLKIQYKN